MQLYKNMEYSRDAYIKLFINENVYIRSVIDYAVSKIDLLHDDNIRAYTIVVGDEVLYDYNFIREYLPQKTKIKISVITYKKTFR